VGIKNQTKKKVKLLHTDNDMEFCSSALNNYCNEEGIVRHHTIPYTPQQNGMVEMLNRTIISKARCMMSSVGMDRSFWVEAATTTCYFINRSPCIPLDKKLHLRYGLVHMLIIHSGEFSVALLIHTLIMKS
jgi:transposase InsO family protein